jgi:hypothetical protein
MTDFPKLIRIVRAPDGKNRAYIGDQQLWFINYREEYGRSGHTVILTIPAEHIAFEKHERRDPHTDTGGRQAVRGA